MVKKNNDDFTDLIALRKVGYGKVSLIDYRFIIDNDYNARIEMSMNRENETDMSITQSVELNDEEKELVNGFINKFVKPKESRVPFISSEMEKYEKEELYYGDVVIEDEELNDKFRSLIDFIQSEHEAINGDSVVKMYNQMTDDIYNNRRK